MDTKEKIILIIILVIGFTARFYKLDIYPSGFHVDEASLAYNAYSILRTGKDENGAWLPMHNFVSQTYRPAGYSYLTIPSILFFGLNEYAVRFPAALFGFLTIGAVYLLAELLFSRRSIALVAAFMVAVSPWHVILSRSSSETLAALFFIISGVYLFLRALKQNSILLHILAAVFFAISLITYPTPRIFVPLIMSVIILVMHFSKNEFGKPKLLYGLLSLLLVTVIDVILIFGVHGGTEKFKQISIFTSDRTALLREEQIREDGTQAVSPFIARFFHNKISSYIDIFFREYLHYLSIEYYMGNDYLPIRYRVPNQSLVYGLELLGMIYGLLAILTKRKIVYYIPVLWLFIGPVTAALTWEDSPNILRSLPMIPAIQLMAGYGFVSFFDMFFKRMKKNTRVTAVVLITAIYLFHVINFAHEYFVHAPAHQPWDRNYGAKELVQTINAEKEHYKSVYIGKFAETSYHFFLFFTQYDPQTYQAEGSPKDENFKGFDTYIFIPRECPEVAEKNSLYVGKGDCWDGSEFSQKMSAIAGQDYNEYIKNIEILKTIYRTDHSPVLRIAQLRE